MSQNARFTDAHDLIFHGQKAVSDESAQITGILDVGYIYLKSNNDSMYAGKSGFARYPLNSGESIQIKTANISQVYVSGSGSVNFIGCSEIPRGFFQNTAETLYPLLDISGNIISDSEGETIFTTE